MNTDKHGFSLGIIRPLVYVAMVTLGFLTASGTNASAADAASLYSNGFDKAELEKVPDDMLVLDGGFAVKEEAGNKFLELPGAPLDTFGVLFGPTEPAGIAVTARVQGAGKG